MEMNDETLGGIKKLNKLSMRIACNDFSIGYFSKPVLPDKIRIVAETRPNRHF